MLAIATGDERYAFRIYERSRYEAEAIVDRSWPLIEVIARALNRRGRLSESEVRQVMRGEKLPKRSAIRTVKLNEPELAIRVDGFFLNSPRAPLPSSRQLAVLTRAFKERYAARCARFGEPISYRSA